VIGIDCALVGGHGIMFRHDHRSWKIVVGKVFLMALFDMNDAGRAEFLLQVLIAEFLNGFTCLVQPAR
jgi:hypothetical protein